MEQLLFTINEAEDVIRVKRSKLSAMIASGEIASVKIGKLRRIPRQALEAYVSRLLSEQVEAPGCPR